MITGLQVQAEFGHTLLPLRNLALIREFDLRSASNRKGPIARDQNIGGICTAERVGVVLSMKWKKSILGLAHSDCRI